MGTDTVELVVLVWIVLGLVWAFWPSSNIEYRPNPAVLLKDSQDQQILCPHCQTRGKVTTRKVQVKRGIDGTKATAAVLTGGASLLVTGLSQRDAATEATCANCGSTWRF